MQSLLDRILKGVVAAIRADSTVIKHVYPYVWPDQMTTRVPVVIVSSPAETFDEETNEALEAAAQIDVNVVVPREDVEADLDRATVDVYQALLGERTGKINGLDWTDHAVLTGRRVGALEEDDTVVVQTLSLRVTYTQDAYDMTKVWPGGISP